ncbi:DAPG hydrolase family protein [Paenarthrobacter sp. NPDC092416]|uniref:DAPG hydrolase family protein n=1 Tax=Paenarthrobacter sp. NPDC092416 TaxID=3364386 RepID=UPI0037F38556
MELHAKLKANELPELTEEQKESPFSGIYKRDIGDVTPEIELAFQPGEMIDPSKAVMPEDLWEYLLPGGPEPEMGYCLLPNGGGYTCLVADVPGVSKEMFDFRTRLVLADHVGFMIEFPGKHLGHWESLCTEDFGVGYMHATILDRSYSAFELGYPTHPSLANPEIVEFIAKEADEIPLEGPIDATRGKNTLVFVSRETDTGLRCWAFVYSGLHVVEGKSSLVLAPGEEITLEKCRLRGLHLAYEYVGRKELLDEYYEEYRDRPMAPAKPWPERFLPFRH